MLTEYSRRGLFDLGRKAGAAASLLSFGIPLTAEAQQEQWVPHWDGTWKRRNTQPGIKFILMTGLGTTSLQDNTFDAIVQDCIYANGYDQHDVLKNSYRINALNPLLGEHYTKKESTQHPNISEQGSYMIMERFMQDFPEDKFIPIGHSQGGYLAYKVATRFPEKMAGVITLNGALKGADIIPTGVDAAVAPMIGGAAATFFLERGQDIQTAQKVDGDILWLQNRGILFCPFASTNDQIVSARYASGPYQEVLVDGRRIPLVYAMEEWTEWSGAQQITEDMETQLKLLDSLNSPETIVNDSARLKDSPVETQRKVRGGYYGHAAVTKNAQVRTDVSHVIRTVKNTTACPSYQYPYGQPMSESELLTRENQVSSMIFNLPENGYQGNNFSVRFDYSTSQVTVTISNQNIESGKREFLQFLQSQNIQDPSWIRNLVTVCR